MIQKLHPTSPTPCAAHCRVSHVTTFGATTTFGHRDHDGEGLSGGNNDTYASSCLTTIDLLAGCDGRIIKRSIDEPCLCPIHAKFTVIVARARSLPPGYWRRTTFAVSGDVGYLFFCGLYHLLCYIGLSDQR